ncbi:MFS transporter [Streptacidiphilus rugosus]|uniref:MFS transporter n=1 Tax=Streptacidiphilus rugosus TaxID=405783 RepID=UPI0005682DF5|nr:MFS transporter [Streptacidiphilus rugosus]
MSDQPSQTIDDSPRSDGASTDRAGTGTGEAARGSRAGQDRQGGLMALLSLANTSMFALYLGVGSVLLPTQIAHLDPAHKVAVLGLVGGVSALFATVLNPVAGALSDRTGRRGPWIVGGALASLAAMAFLGSVDTVLMAGIGWCLGQATMSVYQAATTAVVPDRIPAERRGTASALVGLGLPVGGTVGVLVASATAGAPRTGYLVLGAIVAVAGLLLTTLGREPRRAPKPSVPLRRQFATFLQALANHDFRWAFIGRALLVLGYFSVMGYQLYILSDHVRLPAGLTPAAAIAVLTPVSMAAMIVSTLVGGVLSDRWNRRKLFVGASATLSGLVMVVPVVSPTWTGMLVFSALNGLAFGCFVAVDTALVTLVLPSSEDTARDMGVLNIAGAGPQIVAPFVASQVIAHLGGYNGLFVVGGVLSVLGGLAIAPIRTVR